RERVGPRGGYVHAHGTRGEVTGTAPRVREVPDRPAPLDAAAGTNAVRSRDGARWPWRRAHRLAAGVAPRVRGPIEHAQGVGAWRAGGDAQIGGAEPVRSRPLPRVAGVGAQH